jgi:hypothetical protein
MARWRAAVAAATDWVNARLPKDHDTPLTAHDVGVIFLEEGGYDILLNHKDPRFDGYGFLGIDEILVAYDANWQEIRKFIHPRLVELAKDETNVFSGFKNERKDPIKTLIGLNIEDACFAVAAVVGHARRKLAKQLADPAQQGPWTCKVTDLPAHLQFYWTSTFYNTKDAPTYLQDHGLEFHDRAWAKWDEHMLFKGQSKYNMCWRTATYRYFVAMSPEWER